MKNITIILSFLFIFSQSFAAEPIEVIEVIGAPIKGIDGQGAGSGYRPVPNPGSGGSTSTKEQKNIANKNKAKKLKKKSVKNKSWWEVFAEKAARVLNFHGSIVERNKTKIIVYNPDGTKLREEYNEQCLGMAIKEGNPCMQMEIQKYDDNRFKLRLSQLTAIRIASTGEDRLVYSSDNTLYFEGSLDEIEELLYDIVDL